MGYGIPLATVSVSSYPLIPPTGVRVRSGWAIRAGWAPLDTL
jgi:hypothetical protein